MISFSQRVSIALIYASNKLPYGTLIVKTKKLSICACSIVSKVSIYASNVPTCGTLIAIIIETQFVYAHHVVCGTLIINLGKNSSCAYYCKQIKTSFARIKEEYKIFINNISINNYIYLLRMQR